jgi:hypothetical protein
VPLGERALLDLLARDELRRRAGHRLREGGAAERHEQREHPDAHAQPLTADAVDHTSHLRAS